MKVSEVMNKAIVVEDDVSLVKAAKIMSEKSIGSLIIMKKDKIVGILTERDIVKNASCMGKKISAVMSRSVVTVEHKDDLNQAARLMAENKIRRLPVTDDGELVGIITATDLLANSEALNEDFMFE